MHLRQSTVTARIEHARAVREPVPTVAAQTGDGSARAHEGVVTVRTLPDGDSRFRAGILAEAVGAPRFDAEGPVARDSSDGEAAVPGCGDRVCTGEPRDGLIAVDIVDENGIIGFEEDDHLAAVAPLITMDETVPGEHVENLGFGHRTCGPLSVYERSSAGRQDYSIRANTASMDCVLFDMDGVIVDSEDYWVEHEREELLPAVVEEDVPVSEVTGMNYEEIYTYLDSNYTTLVERPEFIARFEEIAEGIYTEYAELMPGFRDLLADLDERGVRTAIVSSSPPDWISLVTERFALEDFDAIVSADHIDGPGKPEPAIYEHAANQLGVAPTECVVIEDSAHGVESAAAAGTYTIAYETPTNAEHDHSAADEKVSSSEELRERLLSLHDAN